MLKYTDYDIVFQEIPNEVTLAINLSNCPHRCKGCHSPQLQHDLGKELNDSSLFKLVSRYGTAITCICFMGGDATPDEVCQLATFVHKQWGGNFKTAWYSGYNNLPENTSIHCFNFIKLGAFVESLGGLNRRTTNQRLYRVDNDEMIDITMLMWR